MPDGVNFETLQNAGNYLGVYIENVYPSSTIISTEGGACYEKRNILKQIS